MLVSYRLSSYGKADHTQQVVVIFKLYKMLLRESKVSPDQSVPAE